MSSGDTFSPSSAALFERVLSERIDADTLAWLIEGFRTFDKHEGALSLERCLRLPTVEQRRRAERDFWLRAAAGLVNAGNQPVARAAAVANELSAFISRGPWRFWRELEDAPDSASELQRAMFYAARALGDKPAPKWRQVMRVLAVVTESESDDKQCDLSLAA